VAHCDLMETFRLTFGQQYATEPHPRFSLAHPDGWVSIEAADYEDARAFAVGMFGAGWCDLYGQGRNWDPDYFPEGELARFATPVAAGYVPAPVEVPWTAAEHVSKAQDLLVTAETAGPASPQSPEHLVLLARGHLDAARTLAKLREVEGTRQARLDHKGMTAGMQDMLSRVLPGGEGGP
jgi:hypothetical protein